MRTRFPSFVFASLVLVTGCAMGPDFEQPEVAAPVAFEGGATGESIAEVQARYDGAGYGTFKTDVAEAVVSLLRPFQERFHELRGDPAELERALARGAEKARAESAPTLAGMYDRMGFVRRS